MRDRLRLAIPNKGRLLESTLSLLADAGLVFEAHDRSLVARVQNHPLDILFVRTNDVVEFVADAVAEVGVGEQAECRFEEATLVGDRQAEAVPHRSLPVG